jgi:phosphoadenosine phosphosulfate reductase
MQAVADKPDLDVLNESFAKTGWQIIDWSNRQFGDDLVMSSSFGDQAVVLIHLATQIKPDIKVVFVDTG